MKTLSRVLVGGLILSVNSLGAAPPDDSLQAMLETLRTKYDLPALAAASFNTEGLVETAVVGVRKRGEAVPATKGDLWHLGSDTKVMTATLAGTFVAQGKLKWEDKVADFFPGIARNIPPAMREVTLGQVMSHRAGLIENLAWQRLAGSGSLEEGRREAVRQALSKPAFPPGEFHYSNTNYVVIGAVLEKVSGKSWEELMRERIFQPLRMTSAGFGGTGTPGRIDQPWPHFENGNATPRNGPQVDNPEVMGPAGTVHCTVEDWASFLRDQLRGAAGKPALLPKEIYEAIQTPPAGSQYAYGWGVVPRPWAGGMALTHAGSNTMNYCVCWLAPEKGFGVLVCCNQAGEQAVKACDEAASLLIRRYRARAN